MKASGVDNRFGRRLKTAREAANLSQEKLAERAGVARVTLAKYESGKINPALEKIDRLAKALDTPAWWFFSDTEGLPETPSPGPKEPTYREILDRLISLEATVAQYSDALEDAPTTAEAKEKVEGRYLESIEEARGQGREQGLKEGLQEMRSSIIAVLEARFQEVPGGLNQRLRSFKDATRLGSIVRSAAVAKDLQSFMNTL